MSRKIYTYTDLRTLGSAPFWNEIKRYPQITVSADLRKSLKGVQGFDKVDGLFKDDDQVLVCESAKLTKAVSPKWAVDKSKFHEAVLINRFIREKLSYERDVDKKRWLTGCRRNSSMILNSIILLEEANIRPEDLNPDGDVNIELLIDIWKFLIEYDPVITEFRKNIENLNSRNSWSTVFSELFGITSVETVVFHGFYYFTPLQERVITALENTGVNLIFLFPYNENYPYAHEIWNLTYSEAFGYEPVSKWVIERNDKKDPYGEIFEGRKASVDNKLYIQEYGSVYEFIHEIK